MSLSRPGRTHGLCVHVEEEEEDLFTFSDTQGDPGRRSALPLYSIMEMDILTTVNPHPNLVSFYGTEH